MVIVMVMVMVMVTVTVTVMMVMVVVLKCCSPCLLLPAYGLPVPVLHRRHTLGVRLCLGPALLLLPAAARRQGVQLALQ
jgi:hypothetical protein